MKLLIVDDNKLQIHAILNYVDWKTLGINKIETASDGVEALSVCDGFEPDIVLLDIQMPRMNGIELTERLKARGCRAKIIYMTCFEETEYLMAALENDVVSYIVKPLTEKDIENAVIKAKDKIENERKLEAFVLDGESIKMQRENLVYRLLNDVNASLVKDEVLANVGMLSFESFVILIFCSRKAEGRVCEIMEVIQGGFSEWETVLIAEDNAVTMLVMTDSGSGGLEERLAACADGVIEEIKKKFGCEYTAVVSETAHNLGEIRKLSCQTKEIFEEYIDGKRVLLYTKLKNDEFFKLKKRALTILSGEKGCDADKESFARELLKIKDTKRCYHRLLGVLKNYCAEKGIYAANQFSIKRVLELNEGGLNQEELSRWFLRAVSVLKQYETSAEKLGVDSKNELVKKIKEVIDTEFKNINTIDEVAARIFVSASYARKIFKQQTGMTIFSYLVNVKLEEAKKLLTETNMNIGNIGYILGYNNVSHFKTIFKNYTGKNPSEYRRELNEAD